MTSRRLGGWAVVALLACVAFGIFTAWPFLWNVLGVLWFVHLRREMKLHRTANPAPPPEREVVVRKEPLVTYWGNGAGMTIMPATTEGDTTQ